jgi:catechol 2,3-dioxygenase-like lactoylglutathione lyase family enzyme
MLTKAGFTTLISVKDMRRAVDFYTKKLGGKVQMRGSGDMKDSWTSLKIGREEFWLVKPPGRPVKKPDLAFNAFVVKDLRKEVQDLRKKGVRFQKAEKMEESSTIVDGVISSGPFGSTSFFNDSEGNLMMLWQNG